MPATPRLIIVQFELSSQSMISPPRAIRHGLVEPQEALVIPVVLAEINQATPVARWCDIHNSCHGSAIKFSKHNQS